MTVGILVLVVIVVALVVGMVRAGRGRQVAVEDAFDPVRPDPDPPPED